MHTWVDQYKMAPILCHSFKESILKVNAANREVDFVAARRKAALISQANMRSSNPTNYGYLVTSFAKFFKFLK